MKKIKSNMNELEFTTLYTDFSDAQGQVTPQSVVEFCQNLNSSKLLCARKKKIQSKMKELER